MIPVLQSNGTCFIRLARFGFTRNNGVMNPKRRRRHFQLAGIDSIATNWVAKPGRRRWRYTSSGRNRSRAMVTVLLDSFR